MKILVSIKQVPSRDSQLRIDSAGRWIQENDLTYEVNEPDAFALEEALRLKEILNEILAHHTGQNVKKIERDTDRDNFMSAAQSVEYGLIDEVIAGRPKVPTT